MLVRHNIDVMQIEKNICESLVKALLDDKSMVKVKRDMEALGVRRHMHLVRDHKRPSIVLMLATPYVLSNTENLKFM